MTPYGYKIVNGKAEIDSEAATVLCTMIDLYLKGHSVTDAAQEAGFSMTRTAAAKALSNPVYIGTDFYPPLISQETFNKIQKERKSRNRQRQGLDKRIIFPTPVQTAFRLGTVPFSSAGLTPQQAAATVYNSLEALPMPEKGYSATADEQTEHRIRRFFQTLLQQ